MIHDPEAQGVIAATFVNQWDVDDPDRRARWVLQDLADNGLCVVSDAAEPSDAELRAAALETARQRVTFTERP